MNIELLSTRIENGVVIVKLRYDNSNVMVMDRDENEIRDLIDGYLSINTDFSLNLARKYLLLLTHMENFKKNAS